MRSANPTRILSTFFYFCAALPALTQADTISYYLDQSNDLLDGINYLQVTIADSTSQAGDIDFTVDVLTDAFDTLNASNFGMQTFSFNYNNDLTVGIPNIIDINPSTWNISENKNAGGGFGKFEFEFMGSGNDRTETMTFSISNVTGDSVYDYAIGSTLNPSSDEFFAAHVAGFNETNGVTSAQFAGSTPVPVPAAVWLFGSGLLGLISFARRKQ